MAVIVLSHNTATFVKNTCSKVFWTSYKGVFRACRACWAYLSCSVTYTCILDCLLGRTLDDAINTHVNQAPELMA